MVQHVRKFLPEISFAIVAIILALACFEHNPSPWFDEGIYVQIPTNLAMHDRYGIQTGPNTFDPIPLISVGYPVLLPVAGVFSLLEPSMTNGRIAAVGFLLLAIAAAYSFIRALYGTHHARLATILLLTFAPLYGNGRNLLGEVPGLAYMLAGLTFFHLWQKQHFVGKKYPVLAGLLLGLSMAAKPNFLVLGIGLLLVLIIHWKSLRNHARAAWIFTGSVCVPLLLWVTTQFPSPSVLSQVYQHYTNPFAQEQTTSLVATNLVRFVTESTPIHFSILLLIIITGFFIRKKQEKQIHAVEIILAVFVVLAMTSYVRTVGWYRHFFLPHLVLLTLFPYALHVCLSIFPRRFYHATSTVVILLALVQFTHLAKTDMSCYESAPSRAAAHLNNLQIDTPLFINVPELVPYYSSNQYFQYISINPRITYGEYALRTLSTKSVDHVIIRQSDAVDFKDKLITCYKVTESIGGYLFYSRIDACTAS
jgi:hypothetical protein